MRFSFFLQGNPRLVSSLYKVNLSILMIQQLKIVSGKILSANFSVSQFAHFIAMSLWPPIPPQMQISLTLSLAEMSMELVRN